MKNLLFLSFILFLSACSKKQNHQYPNIILIVSDDQGWGDLSFNGNTNLNTPSIDKLAEKGVSFENFFVCPVCSPTRAELLTGRYHPRGGVYSTSAGGERLDLDETTIAEVFKNAGYETAAYGKWHNGMQPPYHPNARGFDDFYGFCSGHWGNYFSPMLEHNGEIVKGSGFIIDDFTNKAISFIEKNKENPFFLYLPFNTPHSPMQAPGVYWNKFKNKELNMFHKDVSKEDINFTRAALAMCENIDWNIGRLTSLVDSLNLQENTIFVYLSDNGPNSWRWNGGLKGRKGSTDEGGVKSPLFIKWDGRIKPGKIKQIAGAIDLLPTLTSLAEIDHSPSKKTDGIDLKPFIFEEGLAVNSRLIFNHWRQKTSVRNQKFRLDYKDKLYDMENDPGQEIDVTDKFPEIAKQLIQAKNQWEKEVLSELPEKDLRTFPIGHPDHIYTQLPARDATFTGNIKRSNRFPNCTFLTNWTSITDKIYWDSEILAEGDFEVTVYYTCPEKNIGATLELSFGKESLKTKIIEAHDPPQKGKNEDLIPRMESYVKEFKPFNMGTIHLQKGQGELSLKALEIPGEKSIDFRLILLKRI